MTPLNNSHRCRKRLLESLIKKRGPTKRTPKPEKWSHVRSPIHWKVPIRYSGPLDTSLLFSFVSVKSPSGPEKSPSVLIVSREFWAVYDPQFRRNKNLVTSTNGGFSYICLSPRLVQFPLKFVYPCVHFVTSTFVSLAY